MTTELVTHPAAPDPPPVPDCGRLAAGFSRHVLGCPLRPYQQQIAAAVLAPVLGGHGTTFTVMMARRGPACGSGKHELSAHLEAALLARASSCA